MSLVVVLYSTISVVHRTIGIYTVSFFHTIFDLQCFFCLFHFKDEVLFKVWVCAITQKSRFVTSYKIVFSSILKKMNHKSSLINKGK